MLEPLAVPLRVTHYHRQPNPTDFSIERLFCNVRYSLPRDIHVRTAVCRFRSQGLLQRLYNLLEAPFRQSDVNHITGDVHYLGLLLNKRRTILTIHDCATLERLSGWRRELFRALWFEFPGRRVRVITTISQATRDVLLQRTLIDPTKVRVVHDCVSPAYQPAPRAFRTSRPVVLQVGTRSNKNLERVAAALRGIDCHLDVIGPLTKAQSSLLKELEIDHSTYENLTDDEVLARYQACDLLVFASTYEGFGLPVVEAQSVGRPVVTSRIPALVEVAGGAAVLVDPSDTSAIRAGILRVLEEPDLRKDLVERGFDNAKRFAATNIASQYADLYREVSRSET